MINQIICFGDSWGSALESPGAKPFPEHVALSLNVPCKNYAKGGSGLGLILHTLVDKINYITKETLVLIVIPPDFRWYSESEKGFYSLRDYCSTEYAVFFKNKTSEWFRYHHALFIFTIQKILEEKNCPYIMMHNFGQLDYSKYGLAIDSNKFLSKKSLHELLTPIEFSPWNSYPSTLSQPNGPDEFFFRGPYFEGSQYHPNASGHEKIAELLLQFLNTNYPSIST